MKKFILFLFLVPISMVSQKEYQRNKILSLSVNSKKVIEKLNFYSSLQDSLVNDYIIKNNLNLSEKIYLQRVIEGTPIYFKTDNLSSSITLRANLLYPNGNSNLNLTGSGLTAGVWDGGRVRTTHVEFGDRVVQIDDAASLNFHGTHVTGTIVASGSNLNARGLAFQANAQTFFWNFDIAEMTTFASQGFLVSNHSYGYNVQSFQTWRFGKYDDTSQIYDELCYNFPFYQIVTSAGNDRDTFSIGQVFEKGGYDLLTGKGNSKNALVIGAIEGITNYQDETSVVMSSFSNWGPTDDGRIKPDLVAQGVQVFSTNSTGNSAYTTLSGTSMASPAISGLILLLQQHYNNLSSDDSFMRSSTLRGLLCHTAREAGANQGPDYEHGWGLPDGVKAANLISQNNNSTLLIENSIEQNQSFSRDISINSPQNLKFTLAWTDLPGALNNNINDDRTPRLINNLDLKVVKDGQTFYPWKLNPDSPADAATRDGDNNVDNIEQVEIDNAQPGIYTILVSHKGNLTNDFQEFALIASGTNGLVLNQNEFQLDNSVFIYPNPAVDFLNYTLADGVSISSIELFDLTGKKIAVNHNTQSKVIDVASLQSGVYFVKFNSDSKSLIKKFVKK